MNTSIDNDTLGIPTAVECRTDFLLTILFKLSHVLINLSISLSVH